VARIAFLSCCPIWHVSIIGLPHGVRLAAASLLLSVNDLAEIHGTGEALQLQVPRKIQRWDGDPFT